MVRFFGRPSRSYASTASPYLDPTSSYPILGPLEDEEYAGSEGGSSSKGRARWEGDGASPRGSVIGSTSRGETWNGAHPEMAAPKKKKKKVHLLEPEPPELPRAGPSSLFNGSHISSPSHHPKPKKETFTGATKRNRQLSEAMRSFSAMDLAPPPPKPRSSSGSALGVPNRETVNAQVHAHANTSPTLTYTSVFSSDDGRANHETTSQTSASGSSIVSSIGNKPSKPYAKPSKPSPLTREVVASVPSVNPSTKRSNGIETPPFSSSEVGVSAVRPGVDATRPPLSPGLMEDSLRDSVGDAMKRMGSGEQSRSPLWEETRMQEDHDQSIPIVQPPVIEQPEQPTLPSSSEVVPLAPQRSPPNHSLSALPSLSIQPPTPMHDVESTPFHADSHASPVGREKRLLGGMVELGAAIGTEGMQGTQGTHESQDWVTQDAPASASAGLQSVAEEAKEEPLTATTTTTAATSFPTSNSTPNSAPNSQPGSSGNSRQSSSESLAFRRSVVSETNNHLQPSRSGNRLSSRASDGGLHHRLIPSAKSSSRSVSPVWRGPVQPPISVPFLPPADPSQPSYLRWDPGAQRWVPTSGAQDNTARQPANGHDGLSRAGSVISSSASSYSQASAQPFTFGNAFTSSRSAAEARRASLPHLSVGGTASPRPVISPTPSESVPSRPISPSSWKSPHSAATAPPTRRMSIEPAYSLSPTMLTFLPEMSEQQSLATMPSSSSRPPSRSHSRPPSISEGTNRPAVRRPSSSVSHYRNRNSAVFPSGYDVDARAWAMSNGDRPQSDGGDVVSEGGSRPPSIHSGSQFGGSQPAPRPTSKATSRAGRESAALDTMSARGDPVPLLGADGTGGEGLGGYTSLVLPTGSYKPSDPTRNLDKIDPRVLGMPTTTMSTITINSATGASRRNSFAGRRRSETPTPAHLLADQPAPVSFSSHQPPPSKISPAQVLVQVYTVALDRTDLDMVRDKAATGSGAGKWVPGRSFCGRALDVGADVRTIVKGDLVMGLVDVKKSGMLAEYITCDRRRIARTPASTDLSLEQLACLPLLGVLAHRAASHCTSRGTRALILNAHEGVGALVCQELSARGVNVVAHAPGSILGAEDDCWDNGAREVFLDDDEVGMINGQHESAFEFVLDTVGGRRVYDAARRVLRTSGAFVTLYGDTGPTPTPSSPLKSSFHSLRRAFVRKDKKTISYVHLSPGSSGTVVGGSDVDPSGLDSRDILELGVMRGYRPKVGVVLPFERAGEGLEMAGKGGVGGVDQEDDWEGTGTVVIRLIN